MLRSINLVNTPPRVSIPSDKRGNVKEQHVFDFALEHAGLNGGAASHHFIGIDATMGFASEESLHDFDDLRHAGHTADQDYFFDVAGGEACVLEGLLARADGPFHQIFDQRFEFRAGQLDRQMLGPRFVGGDERQIDFGLSRGRKFDLGLFRRFLQTLQRETVLAQIDAVLFLKFVGEVIDDALVEIFAAEEGVAVGGFNFEHAVADFEYGNIERAAAQIVDRDRAGFLLIQAVGQRRRGRLVDDAQHFEPGDLAGVLGGLALRVVEIGGDGDDRLGNFFAEIGFGGLFHFLQDEGGNLAGAVFRALDLDPGVAVIAVDDLVGDKALVLFHHRVVIAPSDQALDGEQGVFGVGDGLALGRLADQPFAARRKSDHRRRRARAFGIFDDLGLRALHHRDAGIRRTEINANDFAHRYLFKICGFT